MLDTYLSHATIIESQFFSVLDLAKSIHPDHVFAIYSCDPVQKDITHLQFSEQILARISHSDRFKCVLKQMFK